MLADVAQEFQVAELLHPVEVVDQSGAAGRCVEIEERPHLSLHRRDVGLQRFRRKQIALFALAARVADHAGGSADQRDRPVPRAGNRRRIISGHQMAHMQAVGGGIEAGV